MNEREKLIIKISKTHCRCGEFCHKCIEEIVDFILADRKRVVEPLVKCEQELLSNQSDENNYFVAKTERKKAIDKTLKNAGIG